MEFSKNRNELNGEIVNAVEAHVFKGAQDSTFSGAGEAGEDHELTRIVSGSRLHGGAPVTQFFTRRWCVLGMRMSSRYFATVRRVTWMPLSSSFLAIWSSVSGFVGSSF